MKYVLAGVSAFVVCWTAGAIALIIWAGAHVYDGNLVWSDEA
jgi:hypothetical protein